MSKDFHLFGTDLFGEPFEPAGRGPLAERFTIPPFSVLDARSGDWQTRKRAWLALGIQSEVGRGNVQPSTYGADNRTVKYGSGDKYKGGNAWRSGSTGRKSGLLGGSAFNNDWQSNHPDVRSGQGVPESGTSIFDPVLTELAYRWFCPPGGQIIDPFAGGSVRGIVAASLGFRYWGSELRTEQVEANRSQADVILNGSGPLPEWHCADAREALPAAPLADFVFTCPPYGNLEVYSDDPGDLSTMEWDDFCVAYREVVAECVAQLRPDRFAAIVVGEFRDPATGSYRGFVPKTIESFESAGCAFYNEAILVTPAGSLPIRVGKQFSSGRKLGKSHQQLLVFVKGDWRRAAAACGEM